jgi:hypothetical protein
MPNAVPFSLNNFLAMRLPHLRDKSKNSNSKLQTPLFSFFPLLLHAVLLILSCAKKMKENGSRAAAAPRTGSTWKMGVFW